MINKKLVSPILMWVIVVIGIIVIFYAIPGENIFTGNAFTAIIVASAIFYWLYFFSLATYANRQAARSADKTSKIIKNGVYGLIRHPIYMADIVLAWGIFIFWPEKKVLASVLWLTLVLLFWMKLEEKVLLEKFGNEYKEYKKSVPMIFPKLFKK